MKVRTIIGGLFLLTAFGAFCTQGDPESVEVPIARSKSATAKGPAPTQVPTSTLAIGDRVRLPKNSIGTVGLWLMNPGTCDEDITYHSVKSGSEAIVTDLCLQKRAFRPQRWYAKLAFPGQPLLQDAENMWLPVDEVELLPQAKR
jgi:hypothetical protein